jgi:hypothetical protein
LGNAALSLAAESGGAFTRSTATSLAASNSTTRCDFAIVSDNSDKGDVPWRSIELPFDTRANGQGRADKCGALSATALEGKRIYSVLKVSRRLYKRTA